MQTLKQLWGKWTTVNYNYSDALERHRASGLMRMAVGTAIGAALGSPIVFIVPPEPEHVLLNINGFLMDTAQVGYLWIILSGLIGAFILRRSLNQGRINFASLQYVIVLGCIAFIAYLTSDLTAGTMLALSMPITAAGVLFSRRGLIRTLGVLAALLVLTYLLNMAGLLEALSQGDPSIEQMIGLGLVILSVNGTILNVFSGGQHLLYRQNQALNAELEKAVWAEMVARADLDQAVANYSAFAERVAGGDLTAQLTLEGSTGEQETIHASLYHLGQSLNEMVAGLRRMTEQVRDATQNLSHATTEIVAATTQQTATIAEQNATVAATMATVEEIRAAVLQTAQHAQNVAEAAQQSVQVSWQGQDAVTESVDGMHQVHGQVDDIAQIILSLSEQTQRIGVVTAAVDGIAAQSKLLALNASIEAARAGEEGRGFAVVAMEVRQLAEQSQQATAQISDILNEIQQRTNSAVMVTEEGTKGAESGLILVDRAGVAIDDLTMIIDQASRAAQQIAASTGQQISSMDQLVLAMQAIKQTATQTATSTQETQHTAEQLTQTARRMEEAVASYRLA